MSTRNLVGNKGRPARKAENLTAICESTAYTTVRASTACYRVGFTLSFVTYVLPEQTKQTPWHESASEPYRPSDRRLSAKLVPILADRGCHVVSVTNPYGRILGFINPSRYFFFQVAPQLYSRS
jgi:hypothetical protein